MTQAELTFQREQDQMKERKIKAMEVRQYQELQMALKKNSKVLESETKRKDLERQN